MANQRRRATPLAGKLNAGSDGKINCLRRGWLEEGLGMLCFVSAGGWNREIWRMQEK